jgi:type II secretory pathway pseudopilin PulG
MTGMTERAMAGDSGVTFVETVVVMVLAAVIGLVTTTVIVTTFRRTSEMDGRTTALIQTRQALQRTLRDLRSANPLIGLTSDKLEELVVTSGGVNRDLTYTVTTQNNVTSLVLTESDTDASGNALTSPNPKTVISHLVNDASQPVFSVVSPAPSFTTTDPSINSSTCVISGQTPTTYARSCVGTIEVEFVVDELDAVSGKSICATRTTPSRCYLDVSDAADIRNAS